MIASTSRRLLHFGLSDTDRGEPSGPFVSKRAYVHHSDTSVGFSSGGRTVHRLPQRWNRKTEPCDSQAAICQLQVQPKSNGKSKKVTEGTTIREAIRSLNDTSATLSTANSSPTRNAPIRRAEGPGGRTGTTPRPAWLAPHPAGQLFGKVTPEPQRSRYADPTTRSKRTRPNPAKSARFQAERVGRSLHRRGPTCRRRGRAPVGRGVPGAELQ